MAKRKNVSLMLGLSIPVLMILFIIASIYWPKTTAQPKFNFLYNIEENDVNYNNNSGQQYLVQNGKLVKTKKANQNKSKFFIYDTTQNKSKEISFQDAQRLSLDVNLKSPDGFEVVAGSNDGGIFSLFLGSGTDYHTRYLKGHHAVIKLNISNNSSNNNYFYNFRFLGWIKDDN